MEVCTLLSVVVLKFMENETKCIDISDLWSCLLTYKFLLHSQLSCYLENSSYHDWIVVVVVVYVRFNPE